MIKLSSIKANPKNPRLIKDEKFNKLCDSIKSFPKMMELRPIIIDNNSAVLGGNMRLKALLELNYKEVPDSWVRKADDLTEDEKKQFIIKDNVGFGEWDWNMLANEWDEGELNEWGMDTGSKLDGLKDGEEIEFEQSLQLQPPKEYILIMAEPNSIEWEDLKEKLKLKMVRRGGYHRGSEFDVCGLERVLEWDDFKKRIYADSDTEQK
jgi:hypothetical protein